MLTQTIEINLTQSKLSSIIMRSEEKGREIAFSVIDEAGDPVALEDYSVKFLMLKPDDNVVYADVVSGVLTQTEQMTTSKGAGYYCIRIIDAGTVIYSGQGRVLVDDHVIDDETLDSISEVDGYIFPDDFATHAWVEEYVDEHTGSDVIANPDTPPTDTLETVTIEDTTYDIIHPAEDAVGNPIEITDAAAAPLVKCVSAITGYQEGTGTPSPNNIRPIVAYTEGEIEVRGHNHGNVAFEQGAISSNPGRDYAGTKVESSTRIRSVNLIPLDTTKTYTISVKSGYDHVIQAFNDNGIMYSIEGVSNIWRSGSYSFSGIPKIAVAIKNSDNVSDISPSDFPDTKLMIYADGETPITHTTTYPNAIYRGSEDCVEGEVNEKWKVIDLGDLTWTYASGSQQFRSSRIADIEEPANLTIMPNAICEIYETIAYQNISTANSAFTVIFASSADHGKVYVKDSRYTDAAAFTSAVTGIKLAYKLATPTTELVTPAVVRSLNGYNHIESSTGDLDITYIKQPYGPIIRSAEQADNDLIRITAAYDAASLSNTDVSINYKDYDAIVIYVNDVLTQCGVSSLFTREYLDYCRANNRTLTFFPFGSAYVSYNILDNKLEYAGDNNQGFYIIRIDGINYRR